MPDAQNSMLENTNALHKGWRTFRQERPTYSSERARRIGFFRYVGRQTSTNFDTASDHIIFCVGCEQPALMLATSLVQGGRACVDCVDRYAECSYCGELTYAALHVDALAGGTICGRCATRDHRYCQTCRGYYHRIYRMDHNHGTRSCCISPERTFTLPFIGGEPLQNDTRISVSLPSGEISGEGIDSISSYILNQQYYASQYDERRRWGKLANGIDELGATWQTRQGNWPKRLSSLAHKKFGLKIPPTLMTLVGNIARDNSQGADLHIETTRELNRGARAFGYPGSCWWQGYSRSRCALKTNGGFALRTFSEGGVTGRAWVMPLKGPGALTPTFDTMTPAAYVIFNGYGKLGGYAPARVLSHITGMTYRRVQFTCGPMYINSSAGYLVAAEELAKDYTDGALYLQISQHSSLFERENRTLVHA